MSARDREFAFPLPQGGMHGMSLRDYFAGQFLAGMAQTVSSAATLYTDQMAKDAYSVADAMLKAREAK